MNSCKVIFKCTRYQAESTPVDKPLPCDYFEQDPFYDVNSCIYIRVYGGCNSAGAIEDAKKRSK